jgi:EAL domain-containing protein (putative c-di-GMP-specific phosphodiesterase class I)
MIPDRLLVVDDEADLCDFLREAASECGFEVAMATTHEDFKREYRSFKPGVIIADLAMPDGDGIELLHFLAGERCESQILLLSGFDARVRGAALQIGRKLHLKMLDALPKPIGIDDLQGRLRVLASLSGRLQVEDLERALEADELFLDFQPKVEVLSGAVCGVEGLMRWRHPQYGLVGPAQFIPLFERAGLIGRLTLRGMESACRQLGLWKEAGLELDIAVNLSPLELGNLALPDQIAEMMKRFRLDGRQLSIEVTESGAMEDVGRAAEILARFRIKGFRISLDDFGTGYSSLVWLHRLPFSELKIDRSFVAELGTSPAAEILVRSIVDLAHNLGLEVCAEGVERRETWAILASFRCDKAQGYLVSRPLPAPEIPPWVDAWKRRSPAWAMSSRDDLI